MQVKGKDLKVGHTIKVWWSSRQRELGGEPNEDTIVGLKPYKGPLEHLWPAGARIAEFKYARTGMTIGNEDFEEVVEKK